MSNIQFSNDERAQIISKLQAYFDKELDIELGQFDTDFLLDFISKELGPFFYNRGLYDAQTVLQSKMEMLTEAFYELEQDTK